MMISHFIPVIVFFNNFVSRTHGFEPPANNTLREIMADNQNDWTDEELMYVGRS